MKIYKSVLFLTAIALALVSCRDEETYADLKKKEREAVQGFIEKENIQVITMEEFLKDTITNNPVTGPDSTRNEYVLISSDGVYMQIIRRGSGNPIESGQTRYYNIRYSEYDILNQDTLSYNYYQADADKMVCTRTSDYYSCTFQSGIMQAFYGNSVPQGWIMALPYLNPGFMSGAAKINLIVPHSSGTQSAVSVVYPCFYELSITSQKWQ